MNKKEVLEIRKQFKPEKCTITKLCCCYVNHEKEKVMESSGRFLSLSEDEMFKYFDIFKHTLSGGIGKNMINMEFPIEQEEEGGSQEFLMKLLSSKLEDELLLEDFYDRVIANYNCTGHYLIILFFSAYDVPGKSKDNSEMFDASDMVFSHIMCSICPVDLSKPGLSYNPSVNDLQARIRDWVVGNPMNGFLFPAFNDRATDIHGLLYYAAKPEELQPDFISLVLGNPLPLTAGSQKDTFRELTTEALGENCDFETAKAVQQNLNELIEENKENPDPLELGARDVQIILEKSGVPGENLEDFQETFTRMTGEKQALMASNIAEPQKLKVESSGIKITADAAFADLIETRFIDGRPCLVIAVDDHVEVNGIRVRTTLESGKPSAVLDALSDAPLEVPFDE